MLKEWHNNRYLIMRHGQSKANLLQKVVSWPEHGTKSFGLSEIGLLQARDSAAHMNEVLITEDLNWKDKLIIISSDFLRTCETAQIAAEVFHYQEEIILDERLRERYFGEDELVENYQVEKIWAEDLKNANYSGREIESVNQIKARLESIMDELNKQFSDKIILIVSHGDILQVLQTMFLKISPSKHSEIVYIGNAEIRELLAAN